MRIGLQIPRFTWPDGDEKIGPMMAEIGRTADEAGFASLWVMGRFFQIGADARRLQRPGLPGRGDRTGKLGTLVTGVIYRYSGLLVTTATTLRLLPGEFAGVSASLRWPMLREVVLNVV